MDPSKLLRTLGSETYFPPCWTGRGTDTGEDGRQAPETQVMAGRGDQPSTTGALSRGHPGASCHVETRPKGETSASLRPTKSGAGAGPPADETREAELCRNGVALRFPRLFLASCTVPGSVTAIRRLRQAAEGTLASMVSSTPGHLLLCHLLSHFCARPEKPNKTHLFPPGPAWCLGGKTCGPPCVQASWVFVSIQWVWL